MIYLVAWGIPLHGNARPKLDDMSICHTLEEYRSFPEGELVTWLDMDSGKATECGVENAEIRAKVQELSRRTTATTWIWPGKLLFVYQSYGYYSADVRAIAKQAQAALAVPAKKKKQPEPEEYNEFSDWDAEFAKWKSESAPDSAPSAPVPGPGREGLT